MGGHRRAPGCRRTCEPWRHDHGTARPGLRIDPLLVGRGRRCPVRRAHLWPPRRMSSSSAAATRAWPRRGSLPVGSVTSSSSTATRSAGGRAPATAAWPIREASTIWPPCSPWTGARPCGTTRWPPSKVSESSSPSWASSVDWRRSGHLELAGHPRHVAHLRAVAHAYASIGEEARFVAPEDLGTEIGSTRFAGGLLVSAAARPATGQAGRGTGTRRAGRRSGTARTHRCPSGGPSGDGVRGRDVARDPPSGGGGGRHRRNHAAPASWPGWGGASSG